MYKYIGKMLSIGRKSHKFRSIVGGGMVALSLTSLSHALSPKSIDNATIMPTRLDIVDYLLDSFGEYSNSFECNVYTKSSICSAKELKIDDSFILKNVRFDTKYGQNVMSNVYSADKIAYYGVLREYRDMLPNKIECSDSLKRVSDALFYTSTTCNLYSAFYNVKIEINASDKSDYLYPNISPITYSMQYSSLLGDIYRAPVGELSKIDIRVNKISIEMTKKDGFSQLTRGFDFKTVGSILGYAVGFVRANYDINDSTKLDIEKVFNGVANFLISDSNVKRISLNILDRGDTYFNLAGFAYLLKSIDSPQSILTPDIIVNASKLVNRYRFSIDTFTYKNGKRF